MTSRDFCYWLQGHIEIGHDQMHQLGLNHEQTEIIKRHLALVFKHEIDPSQGSQEHQAELQAIHNGNLDDKIFRC